MILETFPSHYNPQPNPVIQAALEAIETIGKRRDEEYVLNLEKPAAVVEPAPASAKTRKAVSFSSVSA